MTKHLSQMRTSEKEFEYYLSKFKEAKYFCVIKAGGECLNSDLVDSLGILYDSGLLPILVHGGGKQIDDALKEKKIISKKIDGKRITDKKTLDVVVSTLKTINEDFVSQINKKIYCTNGFNGIFYVDGTDPVYGYVGNVISVNRLAIDECLDKKLIPVISSLGVDRYGKYFNPNADSACKFLISELKPKKVMFLTSTGGVYKGERLVHEMNSEELQKFIESPFVNGGMKLKLKEVKCLTDLGYDVQITDPKNLIEELFSKKGHGTYIYRLG